MQGTSVRRGMNSDRDGAPEAASRGTLADEEATPQSGTGSQGQVLPQAQAQAQAGPRQDSWLQSEPSALPDLGPLLCAAVRAPAADTFPAGGDPEAGPGASGNCHSQGDPGLPRGVSRCLQGEPAPHPILLQGQEARPPHPSQELGGQTPLRKQE